MVWKFCDITATYDIHTFRKVIHEFCLRLKYDEKTIMRKSSSSSSLISIHDGKSKNENVKQQSNSMIDNQSKNELSDNESYIDESDIDEYSSNSNHNSSSNDSKSEDVDCDVHSYKFKIESKKTIETHEYSCDPMIYHLLNDNDIYTHDPNIVLNEEYYQKNIAMIKYWNKFIQR